MSSDDSDASFGERLQRLQMTIDQALSEIDDEMVRLQLAAVTKVVAWQDIEAKARIRARSAAGG